jgi:signal transduction histidine kinase
MLIAAGPSELGTYLLDYLVDASTGVVLALAGLIAWNRRPAWRTGPLLVLAGYLWYVGSLYELAPVESLVPYLGFAFRGYYDLILAFVVLAVPRDRLSRRWEVGIVVALAGGMIARTAWRLVATPPGSGTGYAPFAPASPILLFHDVNLLIVVDGVISSFVGIALWLVAGTAAWRLVRDRRPGTTRMTDPVLLGGALWAALAGAYAVAGDIQFLTGISILPDGGVGAFVQWLPKVAGPLGLLLGMSRLRSTSAAAVEMLAGGSAPPRGEELERALQRALRDPTVRVLYAGAAGAWVDNFGVETALPPAGSGRAVTSIDAGERAVAAVVHDEGLLDEREVTPTVAAVVGLAVENARLNDDLRAQLDEVRASRARIVEAADAERRRVERDLHDGAQQRLLALALSLRTIRSRLGPDVPESVAVELDAAAEEVRAANAELRELAQGLDPAILREAGLGAAMQSLADRSPVPVEVDVTLQGRLPAGVETAAYFVTAEALANVAKHARASGARVRAAAADGWLRVDIADDGVGGADVNGSGLRGLIDRVAAVGGTFQVTAPAGGGTRIEVAIPCAS